MIHFDCKKGDRSFSHLQAGAGIWKKKHFVSDIQSLTIFGQFFTQKCIGEMEIIIKFCLFFPNTGFWKLIFRQVMAF
jgi:hypothetical protein